MVLSLFFNSLIAHYFESRHIQISSEYGKPIMLYMSTIKLIFGQQARDP